MTEIEYNNATQQAEWDMSGFEYDYDITFETFPAKEQINAFNTITNFKEYTYKYAKKEGFDDAKDDLEALAKFIYKLGKTRKVPLGRWEHILKWLTNMHQTKYKAASRKNIYLLCFALGLNAAETKEFFLKAYLERPFNYKDISEAVYFFCMNNGLSYAEAKTIIDEIEATPFYNNNDAESVTEQIGKAIFDMRTKEDLVRYLVDNRSGFIVQNQTATNKLKQLISDCYATMLRLKEMNAQDFVDTDQELDERTPKYRKMMDKKCRNCGKNFVRTSYYAYGDYCSDLCRTHWFESERFFEEDFDKINIGKILTDITGFFSRETQNGKATKEKSIQDSSLPRAISHNFPLRNEQFEDIWKGKASFDFIRRALIMFKFYNFFGEIIIHHSQKMPDGTYWIANEDVYFEEFKEETDIMLGECGYVRLYWRNPYDWMFGYCAWAHNPLTEFKNIIYEFYLKELKENQI